MPWSRASARRAPWASEMCTPPPARISGRSAFASRADARSTSTASGRERRPGAARAGRFVDGAGRVLGEHGGIERFTVGQRKGLGIAAGSRRYVLKIVPGANEVVLGDREELLAAGLRAGAVNWLVEPPAGEVNCQAKIRYRHQPAAARVRVEGAGAVVRFEEPQSAVTPGQAVVFYAGTRVLGGGWIEEAWARGNPSCP